jgi:hypothetical protein
MAGTRLEAEEEQVAPNPAHMRLDHLKHPVGRDAGVERRPPVGQHR